MREVYLDFGDGFVDVSHLVKYETLKYSQRAYNDSYRYAQNDCSFTLIYDELIFNQLYLGEAKVKITKDSIPVFLGHTTPNKTKKYNGIVNISTYRIDAIDDLDYMEVEVGDIVYEDCKVLDPLNPTQSIIHKLANIAGWANNRINSSVTIDTVIERFAPTSPEDLVLEVLNTLLYEYGYVLSLDANGNIEFHKWVFPSDTSYSVEFTEDNILLEIERKDSIKKYDSIKTYYYDIGFAEKVMLYRDSNCSYNADGTFKGVSVLNNTYYPFEANVIDETTGTNTIVEQEYTDESIRYFTNKAIKENLDYNYKAFSSDFSSMIATENHFLDSRYNSPMTVTHSFGNKKCQLLYYNTSGSSKDIWYSNVFGDVWYKSTERTCTIDIKDEVKDVYEYRSKYVFDKEVADRFTKALAALYKIGKVYYSFPSEADYAVGAVCRLVLKDTNVLAQIVEKTWNEDKEYWEYQIIQTSFEPLNITGTTTSVKVNVIPAGSFDFTTSSGQIIIPYTDNVSSFTNAIIELDVKRMGVSYLDDWTINAATTNCAGSFTSKGVYKISSVSSTAASITFTATNSFWGTLEKTVYISRASDEIGDPDTPTGLQAVVSESGISLSISAVASGSANVIQKVQWQIKKTSTWVDLIDLYDTNGVYVFNRSTDGYPEITTGSAPMNVWQVRARIMNMSGKTSMWSTAVSLNTSKYKTWLMNTPSIYATASGRSVDLKFYRENDFYGDSEFRVQIRKGTEAWKELGDSGNAYVSDDSYKGAGEYTISKYETYRQTVPLVGQAADLPQDTEYKYRVALYNLTTKVATAYSNEVLVLAKGTGVKDVVTGAIKEAQLDSFSVTAEKIKEKSLELDKFVDGMRPPRVVASLPVSPFDGWVAGDLAVYNDKLYRFTGTAFTKEIEGNDIKNGDIGMAHFATTIRPPRVVASLPTSPFAGYTKGDTVVLTTDSKLYRFDGAKFTKHIDAVDITANSITAGQISAGAIVAGKIASGAVNASNIIVDNLIKTNHMKANTIDGSIILANSLHGDKIQSRTIVTENLSVVARSKINTLSNPADGTTGWYTGTRFEDENGFGLELVAPAHHLSSTVFTVEPNEILKVSFGLQLVNSAGSTGSYGIYFGVTRAQVFKRHLWDKTSKKWIAASANINTYFYINYQGSEIEYVTTYILGSNVDIKDVPAPKTTKVGSFPIYCLQLMPGDVSTQLRGGFNPVNNGYTWRLYTPLVVPINSSQIVAENILTDKLSAITANIGEITSGVLESEKNPAYQVPNVRLDLSNKEFWIGNDTYAENPNTESDNAEYLEFKNSSFRMKVKNFIITSISSVIKGLFRVVQKSSGETLFEVSEDTGNTKVFKDLEIGSTLTVGGQVLVGKPYSARASFTPIGNKITCAGLPSALDLEIGDVVRVQADIMTPSGNFVALGQTARNWKEICQVNSDVYACVYGGDIYKQTNATGNFVALGAGNRNWYGICQVNSDVYACVYDGDIYKQTNATGNFVALGAGNRKWKEICQVNSDVYAYVSGGDIYKQTNATGNFVALGAGNRNWYGICQVNSDVYACVYGGDIYKQTNATGNFVALGQTARNWYRICQVNSDVYACVSGGDIYKQTNATGNFVALGAGNRNWTEICQVNSDVYACALNDDIYKQTNATGNFVALGAGNRNWYGICQVNSDVYVCAYGDIYKQTGVKTGTHNKLHTVEGISGNVVTVNYEHASNRGNGSLKLINAHEVPSTFTRIAKWYNAPIGLGQAHIDFRESSLRVVGGLYTNNTNRGIEWRIGLTTSSATTVEIGGTALVHASTSGIYQKLGTFTIPPGASYRQLTGREAWSELR